MSGRQQRTKTPQMAPHATLAAEPPEEMWSAGMACQSAVTVRLLPGCMSTRDTHMNVAGFWLQESCSSEGKQTCQQSSMMETRGGGFFEKRTPRPKSLKDKVRFLKRSSETSRMLTGTCFSWVQLICWKSAREEARKGAAGKPNRERRRQARVWFSAKPQIQPDPRRSSEV